jgi:alkylation response protein AidB-like acyl-CoA dehydrogenase
MNTFLSETDVSLLHEFQQFTNDNLKANADSLESGDFPIEEILRCLAERGFLGISIPQEYGGRGEPFRHAALFAQAIGQHELGLALVWASHLAAAELINRFASASQKSRILPALSKGEVFGTIAYAEDDSKLLPKGAATRVSRAGDKSTLEGEKLLVVNPALSRLFLVLAGDNGNDKQNFWMVDNEGDNTIKVDCEQRAFGLRSARPGSVIFRGSPVKEENKIADLQNDGESIQTQFDFCLSVLGTLLSAAAVGMIDAQLQCATEFAKKTARYGQPLSDSQAVQWKLADQATENSAARLLTYRAAWSKDFDQSQFCKNSSICKFYASRVARLYTGETIQVLGAKNASDLKSLERFYRDAKMLELFALSTEEEKTLVGREMGL